MPRDAVFSHELCTELARLSRSMGIQIGVLVNRAGMVEYVIAGRAEHLVIPRLRRSRTQRLQGLRLIHTHLDESPLSAEDCTDLKALRLDMVYAVTVDDAGRPLLAYGAHLEPGGDCRLLEPVATHALRLTFDAFIRELEAEISGSGAVREVEPQGDRALIVAALPALGDKEEIALEELRELARAAGVTVLDTIVQRRPRIDPRTVVGSGKLAEIAVEAAAREANLLIFDHELSPSQARTITDYLDLRVIDRTQLILDIFARRARTKEGKIQVELAQLRYNMPRLVGRNPSLSRLAGGIGTRGPGESKLEIDRRRSQERITRLEREIDSIRLKRRQTRSRRTRNAVPVISIIGYTNTGKSTLLNTLTHSEVFAADMLFATLDTSSKRLRFPRDVEVVITDTVGFIRDLPRDLRQAFMATLEELEDADLLLEVIDLSDPHLEERMSAVEEILKGLELQDKPRLRVFNKADKADAEMAAEYARRYDGVVISALNRHTLKTLMERLERYFSAVD